MPEDTARPGGYYDQPVTLDADDVPAVPVRMVPAPPEPEDTARRLAEIRSRYERGEYREQFCRALDVVFAHIDALTAEVHGLLDISNGQASAFSAAQAAIDALTAERDESARLAAIGREVEWEIDRYGDPTLMGIAARVAAGDGFTQHPVMGLTDHPAPGAADPPPPF